MSKPRAKPPPRLPTLRDEKGKSRRAREKERKSAPGRERERRTGGAVASEVSAVTGAAREPEQFWLGAVTLSIHILKLCVFGCVGCVWVCLVECVGCVWVCLVECVWVCLVECVGWCLGVLSVFVCVGCVE